MPIIYALVDARKPMAYRYIGVTTDRVNRYRQHLQSAHKDNTYRARWIRKVLNSGNQVLMIVLEELNWTLSEQELFDAEKRHIKTARENGHRLTNATDGGDGVLNPSSAVRELIGRKQRASWTPERRSGQRTRNSARVNERRTAASRAKQATAQSKRWSSVEALLAQSEKMSRAYRANCGPEEEKRRIALRIKEHQKIADNPKFNEQRRERALVMVSALQERLSSLTSVASSHAA